MSTHASGKKKKGTNINMHNVNSLVRAHCTQAIRQGEPSAVFQFSVTSTIEPLKDFGRVVLNGNYISLIFTVKLLT